METKYVGSSLVVFLFVLFSLTPVTANVGVEYDKDGDFSKYETYAWWQGTPAPDSLRQQQIRNAIKRELESKGLTQVDHMPDLYVVTHTSTRLERRFDVNELGYSGFFWRLRGDYYPPTTQIYYVPTRPLRVDVLDRVSGKSVWRGFGVEYVPKSSEKNAKRIEETVKKIFKKFPPKK